MRLARAFKLLILRPMRLLTLILLMVSITVHAEHFADAESDENAGDIYLGHDKPLSPVPDAVRARISQIVGQPTNPVTNCWGTALYVAGFTNYARPAFKDEVINLLNSKACRKLGAKEPVRAGDIASIYNSEEGLHHSFIVLENDQIFEKASPSSTDLPHMTTVKDRFGSLTLDGGCKFFYGGKCAWGLVNYRCDYDEIDREKAARDQQTKALHTRLTFLEQTFKNAFLNQSAAATDDAFNRLLDQTAALRHPGVPLAQRLAGSEAFAGVISLTYVNTQQLRNKLTEQSFQRFQNELAAYEAEENKTPKDFDQFPQGQLLK